MRQRKFRVWDKTERVMYYGGFYITVVWRNDAEPSEDSYVLMESTGETNKNNEEIWEDDIVKRSDGLIGRVVYYNAMWMIGNKDGVLELVFESYDAETIGNIHESPGLLKLETGV